jgi:hypothetical protein
LKIADSVVIAEPPHAPLGTTRSTKWLAVIARPDCVLIARTRGSVGSAMASQSSPGARW